MLELIGLAAHSAGMFALGAYVVGGPSVRNALNGNFWAVPIGLIMIGAMAILSGSPGGCAVGYGVAGSYEDC